MRRLGYSDYQPINYNYKQFLDRDEFAAMEGKADIVITHGGTGAIIGAVKKEKKLLRYRDWLNMENTLTTISYNC